MKHLPQVTLVCVDTKNYAQAIGAIRKSLLQITPAKTLFFTNLKASSPNFPFDIVKIDEIKSKEEYSHFIVKELWKHINTDFVLVVQHDGYVLNGDAWEGEFLEYDYIGAPWLYIDGRNMGNGGFSIRSKKLMEIIGNDSGIEITHPEDDAIGRLYRDYLEKNYNIKFAPDELGDKFSFELREPICPTFGFHGNFHKPYQPVVVVKRTGALGDLVALEPLMAHLHEAGNKVVLDAPFYSAMLYQNHHFKVFHISQLDDRIPRTVIDLDGSYESKPKQLHLTSYYEAAEIYDGKIRNPQFKWPGGMHEGVKQFKKYVVVNYTERDQAERNIYGFDWVDFVEDLGAMGYKVIQVGNFIEDEQLGSAIQINTVTIPQLMYAIAGASLFVGADSGPAAIAVAYGIPSVIFSGSVDLRLIHPDMSKILWIQNNKESIKGCNPYCWHSEAGTTGVPCVVDKINPPCVQFNDTEEIMSRVHEFLNPITTQNEHQHTSTGESII